MAAGSAETDSGTRPIVRPRNVKCWLDRLLLERRDRLADERAEIDVLELVVALLLQPRELEDPLHQRRQPRRPRRG